MVGEKDTVIAQDQDGLVALVLATLKDPVMPPIDQNTMRFFDRIAYDDGYDGMGLGEEAERLAGKLGDKTVLVLGNHGGFACLVWTDKSRA